MRLSRKRLLLVLLAISVTGLGWLFWPRGNPIDGPEAAIRSARAQALRMLLAGGQNSYHRYQVLRALENPKADRLNATWFAQYRQMRAASGKIETGGTCFYGSMDAVLDCSEPVWEMTPRYDGMTGGGDSYVMRESDGRILAGVHFIGE